jgi:hypothetical protein
MHVLLFPLIHVISIKILLCQKKKEKSIKIFIRIGQVVIILVSLSMWLGVRFMTYAYEKNSVEMGELTLCAPHVHRRRLDIANDGENFVPILRSLKKKSIKILPPFNDD